MRNGEGQQNAARPNNPSRGNAAIHWTQEHRGNDVVLLGSICSLMHPDEVFMDNQDADGPYITKHFYEKLLESDMIDANSIPYVLDMPLRSSEKEAHLPGDRQRSYTLVPEGT
jgi:hypothetical protein